MSINDSFINIPDTSIVFPYTTIGHSQIDGFNARAGNVYLDIDVVNGPSRRRLDKPLSLLRWTTRFILNKTNAAIFDDFYLIQTYQGMKWFKMPLAMSNGLQLCTVREAAGGQVTMTRGKKLYDFNWTVEGFSGPLL